MNKKSILFSVVLAFGAAAFAGAADEPPSASGSFSGGILGTVHTSTGNGRRGETRQMAVDQLGQLKVLDGYKEVVLSTGGSVAGLLSVGNSTNTFTVNTSSWYGAVGCRNIGDNCNVIRLASLASPVYVDKVLWGSNVIGAPVTSPYATRTRVRLFDTQGSTGSNSTPSSMFFDQSGTTGTIANVGFWCTSGTVIMKDSSADIILYLGDQTR